MRGVPGTDTTHQEGMHRHVTETHHNTIGPDTYGTACISRTNPGQHMQRTAHAVQRSVCQRSKLLPRVLVNTHMLSRTSSRLPMRRGKPILDCSQAQRLRKLSVPAGRQSEAQVSTAHAGSLGPSQRSTVNATHTHSPLEVLGARLATFTLPNHVT